MYNQLGKSIDDEHTNLSRQPRVLFVAGFLAGDEGISSHLVSLAKGLREHGWKVALAANMLDRKGSDKELVHSSQWLESVGVQYFFVPFPKFRVSVNNVADAFKSLQRFDMIIRQFKPDIIHTHSISVCPYINILRLVYKIPFVTTCHMDIEAKINRSEVKIGAFVGRYVKSFLGNKVIAVSRELQENFQRIMKVPSENIRLILHGIEENRFRIPSSEERFEVRKALNIEPDSKVVCLIGRLDPVKGHDILIHALSILKANGINAIAICAGTGSEIGKNTIRAKASEAGVANLVRLLGYADARQVLWASDVIVLPSRREAFGLVIAEAMLCGVVPVRTPTAGTIDQIEDGINGFIIPFDDPEALALRLKQLLKNDELRIQMSTAAIKSAQFKFTADRMTKDTIALYKEAIDENSHLLETGKILKT